ncbi:MAG: GGDEF domain-containing protein [Acholeplasmatales bacterium]|nr:GGDEF domain-containing protein [Acholeplasmatales bacterium]
MNEKFLRLQNLIKKIINNESKRIEAQFLIVYIILAVVSLIMTIINLITGFRLLMYSTLAFSLLCVFDIILYFRHGKVEYIARILFFIEITLLCTSFAIIGEPEGFSAIWIALLPTCGLLLYRKRYGSLISLCMFIIIAFLFWTPLGNSFLQYNYTNSFKLRFPILYVAFYIMGLTFELIRELTQHELKRAKDKYMNLSYYDQLTGLRNERSYFEEISKLDALTKDGKDDYIIMIMDLNGLKITNDMYGHTFGCHLIVETAKILKEIFKNSLLFHVGGDEFQAIILNEDLTNFTNLIENFRDKLLYRKINFEGKELILSVSYGFARSNHSSMYNELFEKADKNMYQNKKIIKDKYKIPSR